MLERPPPGSRRRRARIGAGAAATTALFVVAIASCSSDQSSSSSTTGLSEIQSAATVTGITGVGNVPATIPSTSPEARVLQRALLAPGNYNCTDTGVWQPYAEIDLTLLVGEPAGGTSCTGDVLDMPAGTCSATPCAEVPADWRIDLMSGVSADSLLMVVAPVSVSTSEFVCVVELVPQPKQILLGTTTIQQACPVGASSNSIDIPYVPPASSDIPYVPPPVSVDIPAG